MINGPPDLGASHCRWLLFFFFFFVEPILAHKEGNVLVDSLYLVVFPNNICPLWPSLRPSWFCFWPPTLKRPHTSNTLLEKSFVESPLKSGFLCLSLRFGTRLK